MASDFFISSESSSNECCSCHKRHSLLFTWCFYTFIAFALSLFGGWIFYECEYENEQTQIIQKMEYNEQILSFLLEHNANESVLSSYGAMIDNLCGVPLESSANRWAYGPSTFFAFTTATTIGYGFSAPQTLWGRLFVFLYGLPAICLFGTAMLQIGTAIADKTGRRSIALFVMLCVVIFIGADVLQKNEVNGEWIFSEGLYFMFVSITTIGYGDLQPALNKGKWIQFAMIWLGLTITVILIGSIQDWMTQKCQKWKDTKHNDVQTSQYAGDWNQRESFQM